MSSSDTSTAGGSSYIAQEADRIASDIDGYLKQNERKEMLRLLTCGSVDDGKSTLIGRLLYDSKMVYEDQLAALEVDSDRYGTTDTDFDPALLTDGLRAEREQGITIDVAYRYFSTARRKFIIADTPGHEQYTRNMATGASTSDLAIILIDARHGVLTQTRRHAFIVSLLGIRHVVVAINKMDLVDFSEPVYDRIRSDFTDFAAKLDLPDVHFVPIAALHGENVVNKSEKMGWYGGATLMHLLETVHIASDRNLIDLRFPVQIVNRPNLNFRGFCGTLASGVVRQGDEVMVLPSRKTSRVKTIVSFEGELTEAFPPMATTLTLEDEIDVSRGDMLVHPRNLPRIGREFEAMLVWMTEEAMVPGRGYMIKQAHKLVPARISDLRYQLDINTLHRQEASELPLNGIGRCRFTTEEPLIYDPYKVNRTTGSFIVVDRLTNNTVGAGMILDVSGELSDAERSKQTVTDSPYVMEHTSSVDARERSRQLGHRAFTLWITGLTGAGKAALAYALERRLFDRGCAVHVLDGGNTRLGLSRGLGFGPDDRSEHLRRAAEVARLSNDAGMITIASFLSPSATDRDAARELIGAERFAEVYLSAPIDFCRKRTGNDYYDKAERGELHDVAGINAPYEAPEQPDLELPTHELDLDGCVERVMSLIDARGWFESA
ncbi:sulfate adenylyltransferase subunit CysN [Mucisphaera calidilacus]|uniref:Multifunctional fusion protein n=1 Tax=Mucisphaera calidilacus TaxID=2527982 RepID=A0A518BUR3_9BACT|nr:sulfate adenylyltransferase subunit CysN [Mucisphaera calidilacus]QDU70706.1 Bifunctional enzyme CysN/CysC [Mucisphaera calidilacus]